MQSGKLRMRALIEHPVNTKSADLDVIQTWETFKPVWCDIRTKTTTEREQADKNKGLTNSYIRIREEDGSGVTPNMRVSWNSHIYNIIGIDPDRTQQRRILLTCTEDLD